MPNSVKLCETSVVLCVKKKLHGVTQRNNTELQREKFFTQSYTEGLFTWITQSCTERYFLLKFEIELLFHAGDGGVLRHQELEFLFGGKHLPL